MALCRDLNLVLGETFENVVRWEVLPIQFLPITNITSAAPTVITSVGHGLKTGWRVAFESILGMTQLNAAHTPPWDSDYGSITVLSSDTFSMDGVNTLNFTPYTSGGVAVCNTPQNLTGYTAELTVVQPGTTVELMTLVSPTDITIDTTNNVISIIVSASMTATQTWTSGTYSLWLISSAGVVTELMTGTMTVTST